MIYYIDIDGTLTDNPSRPGNPIERRLEAVRALVSAGHQVYVWSARGNTYAAHFIVANNLPATASPKPDIIIDDNPKIRPGWKVEPPEYLD